MIWSDFQKCVFNLMGPDGVRRGIEAFNDQNMRNCVVDLQRYIPSYRLGNVTTFQQGDLTVESQAMVGALPQFAKVKAFYIYSNAEGDDPNCKRYKLDFYPWARRKEMICGRLDFRTWWGCCWPGGTIPCPPCSVPSSSNPNPWSWCSERAYVYSISPHLDSFVIYPPLNAYDSLLMVWDGLKVNFNAGDLIAFPQEASEAVAAYCSWKVRLKIDKDRALAQDEYGAYVMARRALIREYRDNLVTDGQDDEYLAGVVPPPGESLIAAGGIPVVFLQNISALAGTLANCLAAIATVNLTPNVPVEFYLNGLLVNYTLRAGTDATSGDGSILQPNDFSATNQKVWYSDLP